MNIPWPTYAQVNSKLSPVLFLVTYIARCRIMRRYGIWIVRSALQIRLYSWKNTRGLLLYKQTTEDDPPPALRTAHGFLFPSLLRTVPLRTAYRLTFEYWGWPPIAYRVLLYFFESAYCVRPFLTWLRSAYTTYRLQNKNNL